MPLFGREVFFGGVVPAVIAGVLLIAGRRGNWTQRCAWDAVAVAAGYLVGQFYVLGFPRVPVIGLVQFLPFILCLAAVWSVVDIREELARGIRWAGRVIISMITAMVLVQPALFSGGLKGMDAVRGGIYGLIALALWTGVDALAARAPAIKVAPAWLVATGGLSLCLLAARSGSLSQLTGALAGCLAGVMLMAIWRPEFRMTALAPVVALLWFSFSALGYLYGLSSDVVALLAGAAFLPGIVNLISTSFFGGTSEVGNPGKTDGERGYVLDQWISKITLILVVASSALAAGAVLIAFRRFGPPAMF